MKNKILLTCSVAACFLSCSYAQVSEVNWQPTRLQIDGNPNDWTTNLRFYDSEAEIKYELRNDADNLYFVFKSDEKNLLKQIEQAGLKLKLTVSGKPKVAASFELKKKEGFAGMPTPPNGQDFDMTNGMQAANQIQNRPVRPDGNQAQQMPQLTMRRELMPKDTAYTKGFLFNKGIAVSEDLNKNVITFAKSNRETSESAFEMIIPLRELFGDGYLLEDIVKKSIQVQLTINALSKSSGGGNQSGAPGGGMGGGMGGGPGGGMGGGPDGGMGGGPGGGMGGGPGGDMGQRPDMSENMDNASNSMGKKNIKITIQLTTQE
ncbi:MAG: hypothetical protein H6Q20_2274 [Bacteroidetes bacterium]|nr:hypothetical protein [Bacteroidota bacterium]